MLSRFSKLQMVLVELNLWMFLEEASCSESLHPVVSQTTSASTSLEREFEVHAVVAVVEPVERTYLETYSSAYPQVDTSL